MKFLKLLNYALLFVSLCFGFFAISKMLPDTVTPATIFVLLILAGQWIANKTGAKALTNIMLGLFGIGFCAYLVVSVWSVVSEFGWVNGVFYFIFLAFSLGLITKDTINELKTDPDNIWSLEIDDEYIEKTYMQILLHEVGEYFDYKELGSHEASDDAPSSDSLKSRYLVLTKDTGELVGWCAFYDNEDERLTLMTCESVLEKLAEMKEKERLQLA